MYVYLCVYVYVYVYVCNVCVYNRDTRRRSDKRRTTETTTMSGRTDDGKRGRRGSSSSKTQRHSKTDKTIQNDGGGDGKCRNAGRPAVKFHSHSIPHPIPFNPMPFHVSMCECVSAPFLVWGCREAAAPFTVGERWSRV